MASLNRPSKRLKIRNQQFPQASNKVRRSSAVGWFKGPRTLPVVLQLLREKKIVDATACDQVYLELVARDFGDGFVEAVDEAEHAFLSGYTSQRAARTWRERIEKLVDLGFIESRSKGKIPHAYFLIIDPEEAVQELERRLGDTLAQDAELRLLFAAFHTRRRESGSADEAQEHSDRKASAEAWLALSQAGGGVPPPPGLPIGFGGIPYPAPFGVLAAQAPSTTALPGQIAAPVAQPAVNEVVAGVDARPDGPT